MKFNHMGIPTLSGQLHMKPAPCLNLLIKALHPYLKTFLSCMQVLSSSAGRPVSFVSTSMYVSAGRPCFLWPCFGVQRTSFDASSSLLLLQCPAKVSRILLILSESLQRPPYSCSLVRNWVQWILSTVRAFWYSSHLIAFTAIKSDK